MKLSLHAVEAHLPENCPGPNIETDNNPYHQSRTQDGKPANGTWCDCGAGWVLEKVEGSWIWVKLPENCWATRTEYNDF